MTKVLLIFGTRPEAIKLCPVLLHLRARAGEFRVRCCVTAQHRQMLDQVLQVFEVKPDYDLNLMLPGQTLAQSSARILAALEGVLAEDRPDIVLVQGDTTTTFCGALAAFYARIPVGHVEAGLRTGDMAQPFPEELNRVLTTRLSAIHFAPTAGAAENLRRDRVPADRIVVTGNTGIDAVLQVDGKLSSGTLAGVDLPALDPSRRLLVVTAHRRENHGAPLEAICEALVRLARRGDVQIVYPVHRNPNVMGPVERLLGGEAGIVLCEPLDYVPFVNLMRRAYLLITDSGGIQEEGPSLGKPVLVMREKTERPEAVEAGTVKLVGTDAARIVAAAEWLLEDRAEFERMSRAHNPYGDGHASERIGDALAGWN
ncbi:MAG TPA: UDP-N-acetylglucosamine 2-epimerase (non-hydrolyzing) [Bryobacteraceae bacterium]|nr:UDP-N-acetylglucosamine 2-epimerase (non-hydrolyzing) [Bryobacteraceae bacterium]